ncbi:phosphoribosylformylglycinamidine synthase subunit PurS [Streptomyces sp. NPDC127033]|uniref:phosphoribosylformylglycinamidine synthase subunit PurS n=1 Tax=Streptomyces sp. NPDC127033 TaxID=3347110 RepID=UPI0036655713
MARVVVDVMLKPEILDPQGQAVQRALPRLGFEGIADVRQGKRFELEVAGPVDEAALARIHEMAETFLANTVIEDFVVKIDDADEAGEAQVGARDGAVAAAATATAEGSK